MQIPALKERKSDTVNTQSERLALLYAFFGVSLRPFAATLGHANFQIARGKKRNGKRIRGNDPNVFNSSGCSRWQVRCFDRGLSRFVSEVDGSPWLSTVTDEAESPPHHHRRRRSLQRDDSSFCAAANDALDLD